MKHNFSAGPATLSREVYEEAAAAVIDYNGIGLSILEISHRSNEFDHILSEVKDLTRSLLSIPAGYSILFLHGGASQQFAMVPFNLLPFGGKAAYIDTGIWSKKAIKEAEMFGNISVIASSSDRDYSYIPDTYSIPGDSTYLHITSNNTIYGTEFFDFPKTDVPLVSDMSSDLFSRRIRIEDFGLIYAGAQKNIGPAGLGLVVVKDELLGKTGRQIPSIFDYNKHIDAGSLYHTPPVFSIFVALLNLRWLKAKGGVEVVETENTIKARALYEEIDRNSLFVGKCEVPYRSRMNVTFDLKDQTLETVFLQHLEDRDLTGVKGHRSIGGFRASIYNAMSISSINALIDAMREFEELSQ